MQEHYDEFFEEVFTELEDKVCVVTSSRYVVTSPPPPPHSDVSMVTSTPVVSGRPSEAHVEVNVFRIKRSGGSRIS